MEPSLPACAGIAVQAGSALVDLAALSTLPRAPLELCDISIETSSSSSEEICQVLAPLAVSPDAVGVSGLPLRAIRGRPLTFDFVLNDRYDPAASLDALRIVTESLALHAQAEVSIYEPTASSTRAAGCTELAATFHPVPASRCVRVSIEFSAQLCDDMASVLLIRSLTVAGCPVSVAHSADGTLHDLPCAISISSGLTAPMKLPAPDAFGSGAAKNPAVSGNGSLYVLKHGHAFLLAFDCDGAVMGPQTTLERIGLSNNGVAAAVSDEADTLFLADYAGSQSVLAAVDLPTRTHVRWSVRPDGCYGLAVLPHPSLVISSSQMTNKLSAFRISDGKRIGELLMSETPRVMASDVSTETVYVSVGRNVVAVHWDGAALVDDGKVQSAGVTSSYRPVAVVPPGPRTTSSYLVVGTHEHSELLVIALPERTLVHRHKLDDGVRVAGLAGDPSGIALVICDYASAFVHVLSWPLPGMMSVA
jgi:hypothetical protein